MAGKAYTVCCSSGAAASSDSVVLASIKGVLDSMDKLSAEMLLELRRHSDALTEAIERELEPSER